VIVVALLGALFVETQPSPVVDEAFWLLNGTKVTSVTVGSRVEARVVVRATAEYTGSIVVKVRKDVKWWFDSDYAASTTPTSLVGGQRLEIKLSFVPDEASSGRVWSLVGYFIEVEFSATRTRWVMEGTYPPRLHVVPQD